MSERQRGRLDSHLELCAECRREAFYFSEIAALSGHMERAAVRPDFNLRLRAAIRRAQAETLMPVPWWQAVAGVIWRPIVVTAAIACVGLTTYGGYKLISPRLQSGAESRGGGPISQNQQGQGNPSQFRGTEAYLPATLTPVDGLTPEMRRLQEQYLATDRWRRDYVVEAVGLDDPASAKPAPRYVLPTVSTEQVARKVSY